jgi:hypothetical protein
MVLTGCQTIGAFTAGDVNIADHPLPDTLRRAGSLNDFTDKFMAWDALERIIPFYQLKVGTAYAGQSNFDKGLTLEHFWFRNIITKAQNLIFQPNRTHPTIP